MMKVVLLVLIGLCAVSAACCCTATARGIPDRLPESEQMIASMEQNQSVGNMTGDDYIIAMLYATINDSWHNLNQLKATISNACKTKHLPSSLNIAAFIEICNFMTN